MPEIKKNFTDNFVNNLTPKVTVQVFSDKKHNFLKLIIRPSGAKSYYYRAKRGGKDLKHKIGDANTMSVATARLVAEQKHYGSTDSRITSNLNNPALKYFTVDRMFELYRVNELRHRRTLAGRKHGLEVAYDLHVRKVLGHFIITDLDKKMVRDFLRTLEPKGYSIHNKVLSVLKSACNYVIDYEDIGLSSNPFDRCKKMMGVSRSRYLTQAEAKLLMRALDKVANQDVADIFRLALFTGARLSNIKMMEWKDINFNSAVWLIPATRTKTRQHYEIPLHVYALELLKKRHRCANNGIFVFASRQKSKYGYITGGDNVWKEAIKLAGLYHENPNIRPRPHDLRRTFATWQIQSGADISVVSKALCHTSLKHTLIYAHTNVEQVRSSIEGAFDFL